MPVFGLKTKPAGQVMALNIPNYQLYIYSPVNYEKIFLTVDAVEKFVANVLVGVTEVSVLTRTRLRRNRRF